MLSPWFPWGLERPNSRSFRKSLAIVSYFPGYMKNARILLLIPECECYVLEAVCVRNACNAIFSPPKSPRARIVMGEVYGQLIAID